MLIIRESKGLATGPVRTEASLSRFREDFVLPIMGERHFVEGAEVFGLIYGQALLGFLETRQKPLFDHGDGVKSKGDFYAFYDRVLTTLALADELQKEIHPAESADRYGCGGLADHGPSNG